MKLATFDAHIGAVRVPGYAGGRPKLEIDVDGSYTTLFVDVDDVVAKRVEERCLARDYPKLRVTVELFDGALEGEPADG